jgi:hypothetical protein
MVATWGHEDDAIRETSRLPSTNCREGPSSSYTPV